jgi:hypothetical protein
MGMLDGPTVFMVNATPKNTAGFERKLSFSAAC